MNFNQNTFLSLKRSWLSTEHGHCVEPAKQLFLSEPATGSKKTSHMNTYEHITIDICLRRLFIYSYVYIYIYINRVSTSGRMFLNIIHN